MEENLTRSPLGARLLAIILAAAVFVGTIILLQLWRDL